jgi:hypothetical protein
MAQKRFWEEHGHSSSGAIERGEIVPGSGEIGR